MPPQSVSVGKASRASAATGIEGLDGVLAGGRTSERLYVIEGVPGSGKTTLALQFLLDGVAKGEAVLYVTLSETEEELRAVAASHGWSPADITALQSLLLSLERETRGSAKT
jgi:circadian clock protein KaiC